MSKQHSASSSPLQTRFDYLVNFTSGKIREESTQTDQTPAQDPSSGRKRNSPTQADCPISLKIRVKDLAIDIDHSSEDIQVSIDKS